MNIVVTGGGTIAPIDDVRHITNLSTGRFSAEITEACLARGASVLHIHAPMAMLPFHRFASMDLEALDESKELRRLETLRSSYESVKARLHLRPLKQGTVEDYATTLRETLRDTPIDVVFLAMAVSDYEPERAAGKIGSDRDEWLLRLHRTTKVIRSVRDWSPSAYLVGFKLLSGVSPGELIARAEAAGEVNRMDLTVANDLRLIRQGRRTVHLVRPGLATETIGPGGSIAGALVDRVFAWSAGRGPISP